MVYLIFHALNGKHGVYAYFIEQARKEKAEITLAALQSERQSLEHRVNSISTSTVDLDLLEGQTRRVLGYAEPDEVIYLLPKE